ncbi:MAG: MFS transporter [Deltaproteobacteria bacterium]|nr:MFS transporter [Deltaproteobacteria bacterium]
MRTAAPPGTGPAGAAPIPPARSAGPSTFQALRHRNFRLWFFGQLTSLVGTWMQTIAQNWLVYQLTGSARDLGLVNFVGAIPLVPLTLYAGAIADRFSKRRIIFAMQAAMMVQAFILALLCWTGVVTLWHVLVLAFLLGAAQALDTPARQAFVVELVGKEDLSNAIALNSGIFHAARVLGPALAGILVATAGVAGAFFLNGASFLAVLLGLYLMDASLIRRLRAEGDEGKDLWGGVRYLRENRGPRAVVLLITSSALLAMPYYVLIPIFAKEVFGRGAGSYGVLMSAAGGGAVLGSLYAATGPAVKRKGAMLTAASFAFPLLLAGFAYTRNYPLAILLLVAIGFAFVLQNAPANSLLQALVPDTLRGRVLAIYVSLLLGMMRVGSLLLGVLAAALSAQAALAIAGGASLVGGVIISLKYPEIRRAS